MLLLILSVVVSLAFFFQSHSKLGQAARSKTFGNDQRTILHLKSTNQMIVKESGNNHFMDCY